MMSRVFSCADLNESWWIDNYRPDETRFVMFREIEDREREPIVVQLTSLDAASLPEHTRPLYLCPGAPERDILPILAGGLGVTEACTMFYIERSGSQVVYRWIQCLCLF